MFNMEILWTFGIMIIMFLRLKSWSSSQKAVKANNHRDKAYIAMKKIPYDFIQKGKKVTKKVIKSFWTLKICTKTWFEMFKNLI